MHEERINPIKEWHGSNTAVRVKHTIGNRRISTRNNV